MKISARLAFSIFFLVLLSQRVICLSEAQNTTVPVNVGVGVVLDMDMWFAKMGLSCINMALSDFYASRSHYKTRLFLNVRNSKREVVGAAAAVAQNDSSQVKAISAIIKAFGWREAVPIHVDNEFGEGIVPYLIDALQDIYVRVPYRSVIPPSATDDEMGQELYKLMTMQTRVFIVHMTPNLSSQLFTKANEIGMMGEAPSVLESMQGVLGVKTYVPQSKELGNFTVLWKRKFQQENPTITDAALNVYGLWAYDSASALARAVEKIGTANLGFEEANASSALTDLESIGVSQIGPKLREALLATRFRGLAGEFSLVKGQLQSETFQIINVNGNGERGIAFWTPESGLGRKLNPAKSQTYSTSKNNLGRIIWPGEPGYVPKGWEIPTNGKKLQIGVPVKDGFNEFVKVTHDNSTNTTVVSGYCIAIFKAVMDSLPYAVPYEFIPFAKPDGESAGTYNDMVYQVFLGNFDAVVGDTTIIANRSNYVDFTLPYTESGVSMVVPLRDNRPKNAWVFLKPLRYDLWITSGCFFVFTGFVVWVLEHRINEEFRAGDWSHQLGTSLWFAFSTLVFSQKLKRVGLLRVAHRPQPGEPVISNCARTVVIIWFFVVLILTQSYTASLTSLLTVQQLQPTFTDVNQLIKDRANVGYQEGSFVLGILQQMNFKTHQLKQYNNTEECDELLSKGSANGGIDAAFDEIPYMKLFLGKYCSNYTMVQSIYKTDGFGFVFPKGSPLVADVSSAILNITEGDQMKQIEDSWLGAQTNCPDSNNPQVSSGSLSLSSFSGLFLIAGAASVAALIFNFFMFLRRERQEIFRSFGNQVSVIERIRHVLKIFDSIDASHSVGRKLLQDKSDTSNIQGASELPQNLGSPPTPSNSSTQMESPSRNPGTSLPEDADPDVNVQTSQVAATIELTPQSNPEGSTITEIQDDNN
ncbi:Glutamate receptor 2.7 [Morella rubra]|uniref:Glutamate receptor n=1 Tax=Morella rubra TaxID=262757 RepID=A0A6A1USY0_9ROSI|nr:Glutamate receptor 2.7 [Morella rubra]